MRCRRNRLVRITNNTVTFFPPGGGEREGRRGGGGGELPRGIIRARLQYFVPHPAAFLPGGM